MTFEEIDEPIEVIMHFDLGGMHPIRFKWRKRAYRIAQVNGTWASPRGRGRIYHFHVSTEDANSFELLFDSENMRWNLGRVCLDG